MHQPRHQPQPLRDRWIERLRTTMFACLATLLSLPANAGIVFPNDPLTTGSRVPPNIMFILDDSGSMAFDYMPDSLPATSTPNVARYAYTRNSISYNPAVDYLPWVNAAGAVLSGGTSYSAVYGDFNKVGGNTIDLGDSESCRNYNQNDSSDDSSKNTEVCGGEQVFYVPKDLANTTATYLGNGTNYYRYQILSGGSDVVRSEYGAVSGSTNSAPGFPKTGLTQSKNNWLYFTVSVPSGATKITATMSGGTGDGDLYVRRGANPTTSTNNCKSEGGNNNESCSISSPAVDTYYIGIYAYAAIANVKLDVTIDKTNRCGTGSGGNDWINCTSATPTGRSLANELTNYATWFSYHRTRIKVAKAGSSLAFGGLGNDVRVGYRTIWGRNGFNIPVNNNGGLFSDAAGFTTRSDWYSRLQAAIGYNGTPLKGALQGAGEYFNDGSATGPYGPQSGTDQLACRQNFAILTTDGFWNDNTGFTSVGDQDGVDGASIAKPDGSTDKYTVAPPFKDGSTNRSDTLADVAMKYWKTDLRTTLSNIVPTTTDDPAFWQHMVTFGISIGLQGNVSPNGPLPGNTGGLSSWPNPLDAEDVDRIDDLLHASVNGHGKFVAATSPAEFANGLKNALAAITERTGSFSNVAANSTRIDTDTQVFQANYVSGIWIGELSAYDVTEANGVSATPAWKASEHIPVTRTKVFTYAGTAGTTFPTATQTTALDRNGTLDQYKVTGANNAAYIKGARALELQNGGNLRNRNGLLGDIVGSSPAYVSDTDTLYVGANDGMLHAIKASDGTELFTYVPAGLNFANLATISRPDYSHRYFVDGPVAVSTQALTPSGRNILVGSLGKGGKGVFALDVTSPGSFAATNVKWDKTGSAADADMGLVQGTPIIAKLNNNDMAVIVSNGINSDNDHAALFIYNLDTGAQLAKIDTLEGSAADPNGLSAPVAWDDDGDGKVDHVYAGDLHGNIWKFDLSSATPSTWAAAASRKKLFSASYPASPSSIRQPITGGLTVALDPKTYKTWVFFGTGSFMTTGDATSKTVQSLYGLIDNDSATLRTDLQQRKAILAGTADGKPVRSFQENAALPAGKKGWFIDLLKPPSDTPEGERIVSDPQMYASALVVASIIPTADACQSDGKGYVNALDAFTGTSLGSSFFDLPGDDTLTDGSGKKVPIGSVDLGVGMGTMPNLMRGRLTQGGSSGGRKDVKITDPRNVGRVSWREVIKD